ncbi:MAG: DoxX family protein [bacterium]
MESHKLRHLAYLVIRLALGVILFAHGSQKLFGWFGGAGLQSTLEFFSKNLGIPPLLSILDIIVEFFGGLALILGFLTRFAALGSTVVMLVAILKVHLANGFFMNWPLEAGQGHGIEMNIALLGMSLMLLITGAGCYSVDHLLLLKFWKNT